MNRIPSSPIRGIPKNWFWLLVMVLVPMWNGVGRAAEPAALPLDTALALPESPYTWPVIEAIRHWPAKPRRLDPTDPNPVKMECIETPGQPDYIGLEQFMVIPAALSTVEAILDDIDHYQQLFPGYDDVHVVKRDRNRIVTFWEQHIPFFFVPNVKYEVTYLVDKSAPDRKVYRYQLSKPSSLKQDDGFIVLERDPGAPPEHPRTLYTEYDFFDADWGVVKTIAPGRIWKDSVEGIYLSDVAIRLKAEHPEWSYGTISVESKKFLERYPVDPLLKRRKRFNPN